MISARAKLRILALTVPAMLTATGASALDAADKVYTMANYPVEARANDAVAAKEQALADGQKAAFRSLLKRLVPVTAYKSMERLKGVDPAELVDGVAVRSERNSSTEYIASLDFQFQAEAVRNVLRREGVPYIEMQAPLVVVVPVIRDTAAAGTATEFRAANTGWAETWNGLDLSNSVTPIRVEPLKAETQPDALRQLMAGDATAVRALAPAYRADRLILAIAEIDHSDKRINVTIAGDDAVGPFVWTRAYRISDGDTAYSLELAAVVSLGVIEGRWKALNEGGQPAAAGTGSVSDVQLQVVFATPDEWSDLRGKILDTYGIDDVRVGDVSSNAAQMSLKFPGGGAALASALSSHGVFLQNAGTYWTVRSGF